MKRRARPKRDPRRPVIVADPCDHCGEPLGEYGWVVNGRGEALHYPACFREIWAKRGGPKASSRD